MNFRISAIFQMPAPIFETPCEVTPVPFCDSGNLDITLCAGGLFRHQHDSVGRFARHKRAKCAHLAHRHPVNRWRNSVRFFQMEGEGLRKTPAGRPMVIDQHLRSCGWGTTKQRGSRRR